MRLDLSDDQELFRETTERYLREHVPAGELRRRRDDPAGFDADYWRRGAELGWTSLLVDEARGGGSISGDGLVDLTLAAHEFGRHAAPGPLLPVNVVAAALNAALAAGPTDAAGPVRPTGSAGDGADTLAAVLAELVAGTRIASWCLSGPRPHDRLGATALTARVDGGEVVVDGVARPVEAGAQADHFLVTARTGGGPTRGGPAGEGLTQVLVPADAPGVSVAPMHTVDLTRRFAVVTFAGVRVPVDRVVGAVGGAAAAVERQLRLAAVISCAEAVGAMQAAFDMTVAWAFDRYSFGRPLASYQALKHRFADMKSWLEASHAVTDAAAAAVSADRPDAAELASAAKAFVGDYGSELLQDCVQLHGGIGVTFEHDLHLFLRRHTVARALHGTPSEHRQRLADITDTADHREDAA
ncbi:MAG TPA: acyl-CoA dehydrogenase family protein [Acidimicrobiales bacterium]